MTDWYQTKTARKVGFNARPVVGGVFLQMLYNKDVWHKYASRDKTKAANWAPLPHFAKNHCDSSRGRQATGHLELHDGRSQAADWMSTDFNDSSWTQGESGFGTAGTPGAIIGTTWQTDDIWLRREVDIVPAKLMMTSKRGFITMKTPRFISTACWPSRPAVSSPATMRFR